MTAIPDTQLGLPPGELALLRQHHSVAMTGTRGMPAAARGRGAHRAVGPPSSASSRAASAASSASGAAGRIMLDAGSLSVLGAYFDRLMGRIQERVEYLSAQTSAAAMQRSRGAAGSLAGADAEIARFKEVLRQIDELETEFDKVRHIRDIVKGFRGRVEGLSKGMRR